MWNLSSLTRDQTLGTREVPKETHLCTTHPLWPKHQNKMSLLESEIYRKGQSGITNNRHRTVTNSIPSVLGRT